MSCAWVFPLLFLLVVLVKYETSDADSIYALVLIYVYYVCILLFVYSSLLLNKLWDSTDHQS